LTNKGSVARELICLRWFENDNTGVDLGIWDNITLNFPCPLHSGNVGRKFRKQNDGKKALQELDNSFKIT
jgi:hypothetical protein